MNDFMYWIRVLINPAFWLMNDPYSEQWDRRFNELAKAHKFKPGKTHHTAYLGDQEIWVANYPYAAFKPFVDRSVRPSRVTIFKAKMKLKHDIGG